jgi:hypothetical protein
MHNELIKYSVHVQIYYSQDSNGPPLGIYEANEQIKKPQSLTLLLIEPVRYDWC